MNSNWMPDWAQGKAGMSELGKAGTDAAVQTGDQGSERQVGAGLVMPVSADMILEAIKEVEDPELGIGIVDLGLIYGIGVEDRKVRVRMTLTSPGCPVGPMLQSLVHGAVKRANPGAEDIKVDLVWAPPWDPYEMASEEAKDMLGIW